MPQVTLHGVCSPTLYARLGRVKLGSFILQKSKVKCELYCGIATRIFISLHHKYLNNVHLDLFAHNIHSLHPQEQQTFLSSREESLKQCYNLPLSISLHLLPSDTSQMAKHSKALLASCTDLTALLNRIQHFARYLVSTPA
jgi:hypothetical protein